MTMDTISSGEPKFTPNQWFSPFSSTNKTDHHDITEILLKMPLNTINPNLELHKSKYITSFAIISFGLCVQIVYFKDLIVFKTEYPNIIQ